jgi:hypothetical protein
MIERKNEKNLEVEVMNERIGGVKAEIEIKDQIIRIRILQKTQDEIIKR